MFLVSDLLQPQEEIATSSCDQGPHVYLHGAVCSGSVGQFCVSPFQSDKWDKTGLSNLSKIMVFIL